MNAIPEVQHRWSWNGDSTLLR